MKKFFSFRPLLSRRAPSLLLPSLCIATGLMVQGCPAGGSLENKDEFLTPGAGTVCDPTPIFEASCAGGICHTAENGMTPGGSIDLFSPGFGEALIDRPATYASVTNPDDCPETPELIVNSANISESLMLKKVYDTHSCGSAMPIGPSLSDADIACLESWATGLVEGGGMGAGTGGADAGTGGADAGTGGGDMTGTGGDMMGTGGGMMGTGGGMMGTAMAVKIEAECSFGTSCNGLMGSYTGEPMLEDDPTKVGYLGTGVTLVFEGVNAEGLNQITFNYAKGNAAGGAVEVHLGTADGMLVGTFTPAVTTAWDDYTESTIDLTQTLTGTQTIVLVFVDSTAVCNLDWFELKPGAAAL